MPTTPQLTLLMLAVVLFAAGGAVSLGRLWTDRGGLRAAARLCLAGGIVASLGVLVWHSLRTGQWLPIGDNFNALIWLAVLLALFVAYVQQTRPLGGLDWFVMPMVILLLLGAAFFGRTDYHPYVDSTWWWVHRAGAYGGAAGFAIAAAAGAMYVITSRKLRRKQPVGPYLGNLERLERLTMAAVTLGFALLTIGLVTGVVSMVAEGKHTPMAKLILACSAWLVYAIVMHAPINPSFRGRKAAALSVFGFVLMVGTIVAVQLMPGGAQ